jgi:hypothetical protein
MPLMPKATNSTNLLCAAAFLLSLLCIPSVQASVEPPPDWLRSAAKETVPTYSDETVAVILLDETQTTINDKGDIQTLYRRAFRVLRPEARENFGNLGVYFDPETKISYIKAWTIPSDGHVVTLTDKDATEGGLYNDIEYTDGRVKALKFAEVNPGSVIGYEYVQKRRPFIFEESWDFQDTVPVRLARYTLQMPTGWEYTGHWINFPEQKPAVVGNQYTWELHDLPAIEDEPQMPTWQAIAGRLGLKYSPSDPALRAKATGTWNDIGVWYGGLTQSSRTSNAAIHQKVMDLTSGIPDTAGKMRAITEYMQKQIRYFAVELGIGGFQPHQAVDIFNHQYGDCKDKVTLLGAMLHEIGVDSYYVPIHTNRGIVRSDYPSIGFNHVIIAIHLPDGVSDSSLSAAIYNDPKLGRLLFFDPTNEYVPLGNLPYYLQNNYGLLVSPTGGELVSLPLSTPDSNHLLRTAKFTMTADGALTGEVQETRSGTPAYIERDVLTEKQPAKRAELFENFLGRSLSNFQLMSASIGNLDQSNRMLVLNYKFSAADYGKEAGDLLIFRPLIIGVENWRRLEDKPRKYPVEFEGVTREDDMFDIVLPQGYTVEEVPPPFELNDEYASYHSEVNYEAGVLHYKRTYTIKQVEVPTPKLEDLKQFLGQVTSDENSSLAVRRVAQ